MCRIRRQRHTVTHYSMSIVCHYRKTEYATPDLQRIADYSCAWLRIALSSNTARLTTWRSSDV
jgi:hypothetical protein